MDPQQCKVVELKFFAGLSIEDTAEVLGISASTVKRDWITARAWLYRELDRSSANRLELPPMAGIGCDSSYATRRSPHSGADHGHSQTRHRHFSPLRKASLTRKLTMKNMWI